LDSDEPTVKLGDFGLATEVTGFLHDVVGLDLYHAPEMFTAKGSVNSVTLPSPHYAPHTPQYTALPLTAPVICPILLQTYGKICYDGMADLQRTK